MTFTANEDERRALEEDPVGFNRGWHSLKCHMGVWDEGVCPVGATEDEALLSQLRGKDCFFFPYKKSMLLPAAMELQKREETNSQLKTSYKYTVIGLWLAGIGLILNAIFSFLTLLSNH